LPLGARKKLLEALKPTAASNITPSVSTPPVPTPTPAAAAAPASATGLTFPPADPEKGMKDSRIDLEGRKSIRDNGKNFAEFTERLKKVFGPEYYFSFDYGDIVASIKEVIKTKKPDPGDMHSLDDYPKRIGEILHCPKGNSSSYMAEIITNLELFAKDTMNRDAFKEKTPAHAVVIRPGPVSSEEDPYRANKFAFKDGAFIVTFNPERFWTNIELIARSYELQQML